VNSCAKLLLVLLAESAFGFGQQAPASTLERVVADAQAAQAGGHYSAAAADYAEAVKMRPDTPELWANLGLMQQETGDLSAAASSFLRANRLNPALYVPNLFLGIDYAHGGRAKEAIPLLMKAEKINPTDPQAPLALGRAYIADGNFSAAARALHRAIALSPKLGPAWFTLGIARLDQVEADARILSEEGKQSSFAGALYAESLVKQARYGEAASLYKTLLDSQPQPPCLRSELGFALLREHDRQNAASAFSAERAAHPECGLALLGQARIAMEEGDAAEATSILQELWNRDRGFFESHASILAEGLPQDKASAMATVLSAEESAHLPEDLHKTLLAVFDPLSQNPSGASPATEEILAEPASASHPTAQSDYSAGEFRQCALRLESSVTPLSADKLRLLAACSFLTGDNERASKAADALRELEPRSLEALYWSIQANERVAFQSLARFQELEPDSARSHVLLGDIYQQLERHEDAQAEYRKALALAPGDPAATLGLASAYLSNGNDDGAMELARSALASSPGDPEMNLILGEALMSQRAYAEAEPYLLKSLHAKPQMLPRIHALIGKAYAETGRTQEAIEQLKLGAASDEDGSVEYLLARLYRKIGDSKDANEALERMKTIKEQRETRGMKRVEDPDLSPLEAVGTQASAP
jgi:tetratricopeptide (TPR) repeat protein